MPAEDRPEVRRSNEAARQHTLGFCIFYANHVGLEGKWVLLMMNWLDHGIDTLQPGRQKNEEEQCEWILIIFSKPYDYTYYRTGIAVGDYPVDHHHAQYPGRCRNEFPKIPYTIPMGNIDTRQYQRGWWFGEKEYLFTQYCEWHNKAATGNTTNRTAQQEYYQNKAVLLKRN